MLNNTREKAFLRKGMHPEIINLLTQHDAYVIGGAITSLFSHSKINDIDIYFENEDSKKLIISWFKKSSTLLHESPTALTFIINKSDMLYQLIIHPEITGKPEDIFKHFDYTICMGAYSFKNDSFYFHDDFFKHLAQRRLVFNPGTKFPISSLVRIKKYMERGYSISGIEIIKIALQIQQLSILTNKDLANQLGGIDVLLLDSLLKEMRTDEKIANMQYDYENFGLMLENHLNKTLFRDETEK